MSNRYIVIMAGGRGERFWPQSRLKCPKQLLPIVGDKAMLAQTVERLEKLVPTENIFIITNREQKEKTLEVCPQLDPDQVIGEPIGRDTAAAVGLATILVKQKDPNAVFAMLPADQVIHDTDAYCSVMNAAFKAAGDEQVLVTIGIQPTYPATGFGYIHRGDIAQEDLAHPVYIVNRFVEKPVLATAKEYIDSKEYYWNAGMFIWQVASIEKELSTNTPSLWNALQAIEKGLNNAQDLDLLLEKHYPDLEKISIDYAVMERAKNVRTIPSTFDWDDVGDWPAVARHLDKSENDNVIKGSAIIDNGSRNIVINENGHFTALIGVDDLIVVQTSDATLVCPKAKAQEIKSIVKEIEKNPAWQHLI